MNFNIIVTSKCNLRCPYCYEGKHKADINMSEKVAHKTVDFIKDMISQNNGIKKNHRIVFHGGEPLLNFNIIQLIKHRLDQEIADFYHLAFVMTTNGTILTEEIIQFIKHSNIQLSVSIDGTRESHNQNRVFENKAGSFDLVMQNLLLLMENEIKPRCRMTYTPANVNQLFKGILELAQYGLEQFVPVADFYDPHWSDKNILDLEAQINQFLQNDLSKNIKVSLVDPHIICSPKNDCFGGITSYTISETGAIFPCVFTISDSKFIVGNLFEENYIAKDYVDVLTKERFFEKSVCKGCHAEEYCSGSQCKLLNYMVTQNYGLPPAIQCKLMQVELNTYKKLKSGGAIIGL